VLKAGPIAAFTDTIAVTARTDTAWLKEGIVANVVRGVCRFILVALTSLKQNCGHLYSPPSRHPLLAELFLSIHNAIHSGGIYPLIKILHKIHSAFPPLKNGLHSIHKLNRKNYRLTSAIW
jgi:hypothetical protein